MIRHMVFLNYRNDLPQSVKEDILRDLSALKNHIDGTLDFRHHHNISPEAPVIHGFSEMFWFDFRDENCRDAYLENETHQAIAERIVAATHGGIAGIFVCDIEL